MRFVVRHGLIMTALALSVMLSGCGSLPLDAGAPAKGPVSQQLPQNEPQKRAKVHTELGAMYLQRGNVAVALDEGKIALQADAGYAPAHNLMGLAYMQLGENSAAEDSFRQALRLAPQDPEINNNYGWFLCRTERERQALGYFNTAIKSPLYATPALANTNAGICLLRLKEDDQAALYFARSLQFEPGNVQARYSLADIAYRRGEFLEARQHLATLHQQTEPLAISLWLAIRVEHALGDRLAEARLGAQLRKNFAASPEYQKFKQGLYE